MTDIHRSARTGYTQAAKTYTTGRPGYPTGVDEWLGNTLGLTSGKTVLDLGAGTGKFTAHLARTGATVIAVEPVGPMLDELRKALPSVQTRLGGASGIPVADQSIDALLCAQAFHWFASTETLAEIRRVLKPGGSLGLVWNTRDENCDWVVALSRIMAPYETDTPRFHEGQWRSVFPAEGFGPLQEQTVSHSHRGDPQSVIIDRVLSVSFIAALPASEQAVVVLKLRQLIASHPKLKGKPDVAFPYTTLMAWAHKTTI